MSQFQVDSYTRANSLLIGSQEFEKYLAPANKDAIRVDPELIGGAWNNPE
jgi:hypothetical protein